MKPEGDHTGWVLANVINAGAIAALIYGLVMGRIAEGFGGAITLMLVNFLTLQGLKPPPRNLD